MWFRGGVAPFASHLVNRDLDLDRHATARGLRSCGNKTLKVGVSVETLNREIHYARDSYVVDGGSAYRDCAPLSSFLSVVPREWTMF